MGLLLGSQLDVLVERERELALLEAAFEQAAAGQGYVVLVTAEAGGGKSALLERFCSLRDPHTRLLQGACDALSAGANSDRSRDLPAEHAGIACHFIR